MLLLMRLVSVWNVVGFGCLFLNLMRQNFVGLKWKLFMDLFFFVGGDMIFDVDFVCLCLQWGC